MAATLATSWYGGSASEPVGAHLFGGNLVEFGRSDIQFTEFVPPVPPVVSFPTPPGTNYSYVTQVALDVILPSSPPSTLVDATVALVAGTVLPPGVLIFWRANGTYLDQTVLSAGPTDVLVENVGQPATPPGYTILTTLPAVWDVMGTVGNGGVLGRVSVFLDLVLGVSSTFVVAGLSHTFLNGVLHETLSDNLSVPVADFINFTSVIAYSETL